MNTLQEVRQRLSQLDPNNRDHLVEIASLKTKEAELLKQQAEAELQAQHEERVKESVETIVNALDTVEIEGLPLRSLFAGEAQYQLVSIWFKEQFAQQAENFSKQIQQEQAENKQLREEIKEQEGIINALKDEIHQLKLERDQAIQYRDNAAAQLEEAQKEVARLNDQVDDLRKEIAVGARNAFKVTNLDGAKELAERIKASLTPVLSIELVNSNTIRITHLDGTQAEDNWLAKGKYRVVDEEEAARFRAEQEAKKQVEESSSSNPPLVEIEPPTFQVPQDDSIRVPSLQPGASEGDSGDQRKNVGNDSLEERIAALEIAVFGKAKGAA